VLVKSFIGLRNQMAMKPVLAAAVLVSPDQKDRVAFRVEREGNAPKPPAASNRNSFIFASREPLIRKRVEFGTEVRERRAFLSSEAFELHPEVYADLDENCSVQRGWQPGITLRRHRFGWVRTETAPPKIQSQLQKINPTPIKSTTYPPNLT
jgi:hypothetical protein